MHFSRWGPHFFPCIRRHDSQAAGGFHCGQSISQQQNKFHQEEFLAHPLSFEGLGKKVKIAALSIYLFPSGAATPTWLQRCSCKLLLSQQL